MLKLQILCGTSFFKSSLPAREDFLGQASMSEARKIPRFHGGQRQPVSPAVHSAREPIR
jgi:hypothetical protein